MKKIKFFGLFLSSFLMLFAACNSLDKTPLNTSSNVIVTYKNDRYAINNEKNTLDLLKVIYKDRVIKAKDIFVGELESEKGKFFGIKAILTDATDREIPSVTPLVQKENSATYTVDCTMMCTSESGCGSCQLNIVTPCGALNCGKIKCNKGSCASAVIFGE